jgi:uncharacterized protein (TIGR00730 family)
MTDSLIAVFGSARSQPGDGHWEEAATCGRLLAEAGLGVVTGGYGGSMEAASQGAAEAGGRVVAVTAGAVFGDRARANRFVAEERTADTITERIHKLVSGTAASITLPGSIGTFTEMISAWNAAYATRFSDAAAKPVVAVGAEWRKLLELLAPRFDASGLVTVVDSVGAAVDVVVDRLRLPAI